jgi:hypothetical protein
MFNHYNLLGKFYEGLKEHGYTLKLVRADRIHNS